uniref:Phosphoglycerate kinase n=1 Tax=Panagrellus redivivus TaxID=6233 RepID=A0A7E4ZXK2_PANRE
MTDKFPMTPLNRFLNRSTEIPKPAGFSNGKGGMKYGIEDHNVQSLIHGIPARAMVSYSWRDIVAVRGGGFASGRSTRTVALNNAIDKAGGDCVENMDQSDQIDVQENQDFQIGDNLGYDDTRTDVSMDSSHEVGAFNTDEPSDYGVFDVLEELGIDNGIDAEEREYLKLLQRFG